MQHANVTVIGAGTMGNGIAHVFAQAGWDVVLVDVSRDALDRALATIGANLDRQVKKGTLTAEQKQAVAEYGRVGAKAFGEVESALSAAAALEEREALLREAVAENARALEFANLRYRVGAGDLRAVQQQALALSAARTALLRVQAERLVQRVNLHLALGGSFEAKR